MTKILGLIASQRRLGNGEILVKEAAGAAGDEYELELIRLADLELKPCKGCYTCLTPGKLCPIQDDLYLLADKIKSADGIIFSAPCYALGPAAVTKLWGDRIIALAQDLEAFSGKPCIVIGTAGVEGMEGYTMSAIVAQARFMGFAVKDAHMFLGALPGESIEKEEALRRVRQMGQALFGEARQAQEGECPTCWSQAWKFPRPDFAVCTLCGQEAMLLPQSDGIHWEFTTRGKRFDQLHLKNHFQVWLRAKVEEFLNRRKELARIRNPYKEKGNWSLK